MLRARSEQVQDEQDPRLAHEQASLRVVLGEVGCLPLRLERALKQRKVVPLELDEAAALQRLERPDDARRAEVQRPEDLRLVAVLV